MSSDKQPIVVDTMEDFKRFGFTLAVFCDACTRYHEFNIDDLIAGGHGGTSITAIKPRCSQCGERAQKLVSPRRSEFDGYPKFVPTGG